ncbi:MAG: RluA family pseudouridine synthase [Desulfatibacillaceae bacterium]
MDGDRTVGFRVEGREAGIRLDAFLTRVHPEVSRSRFHRLITEGRVLVDGTPKKPSYVLSGGEKVLVAFPAPEPMSIAAEAIPLSVLFEDSGIIVINKPPGLVVHPAPGHFSGTLVNALLHHADDLSGIGGVERPGIVHRLDKDTSGVLVVAKNDTAHQSLCEQFAQRRVKKTYLALVAGETVDESGDIDMPIGRHPLHRKRMQASPDQGRPARTLWRVRERLAGATLLELDLLTGRTHQARVHCAYLGNPVVGDPLYAGRGAPRRLPAAVPWPVRQMLHAWKIALRHPGTGEAMEFAAPMPPDMAEFVERLGRK